MVDRLPSSKNYIFILRMMRIESWASKIRGVNGDKISIARIQFIYQQFHIIQNEFDRSIQKLRARDRRSCQRTEKSDCLQYGLAHSWLVYLDWELYSTPVWSKARRYTLQVSWNVKQPLWYSFSSPRLPHFHDLSSVL
jgi:hypothetical protein